jgi:hypothetical protein
VAQLMNIKIDTSCGAIGPSGGGLPHVDTP